MLHFPRWQVVLILVVVIGGFLAVLPNFFSKEQVQNWPGFNKQMVLGLDLQGGAYLLYEVDQQDYVQKRLKTLVSDVRKTLLQEPRIGYTGLAVQGDTVQLRIRDLDKLADARKRLEPLRNSLVSSLLGGGTVFEFDLTVGDDGLTRFTSSARGLRERLRGIVSQSIEVINTRINQLGTTEPSIQRQGDDRILVEAPGLGDPARLKALVGQTAQLTFHMVQSQVDPKNPPQPKPGTVIFPSKENPGACLHGR